MAGRSGGAKQSAMTADLSLPRQDWTLTEVEALFARPFMELVFEAASVHRHWFDPSEVQKSQLLSIKTGGCAENCGYCSQSAAFDTGLKAEKLMDTTAAVSYTHLTLPTNREV